MSSLTLVMVQKGTGWLSSSCVIGLFSKIAAAATYHLLQDTMGMHQLIILDLVHPQKKGENLAEV